MLIIFISKIKRMDIDEVFLIFTYPRRAEVRFVQFQDTP